MARWWRAHAGARNDPKVQRLPGELFKAWFNVLCVASDYDGILPCLADMAFELHKSEKETARILKALGDAGLLDEAPAGLAPHNWTGRQYKSDVSTERVKLHRERRRNVSLTVPGTDSENREQKQKDSEAKASAGQVPARDIIFAESLPWINRRSGKECRSLVAKWCHTHGDDETLRLLQEAESENPIDPVSWIAARFLPKESWRDKQIREGEEAIDRALQ